MKGHKRSVYDICKISNTEIISCSSDQTIKIWDTLTYKCGATIDNAHDDWINKLNGTIISCSDCVSIINQVSCAYSNSILSMGNDTLIVGGDRKIMRIDVKLANVEIVVDDESMGNVFALLKLNDDTVLCGSDNGKIFLYDNIHKSICNEEQCPLYNFRFRR